MIELHLEHVPLYFIIATIFFISNLIPYISARSYLEFLDNTYQLAAYIALFYEHRPSAKNRIGNKFGWEWTIKEWLKIPVCKLE